MNLFSEIGLAKECVAMSVCKDTKLLLQKILRLLTCHK